jgi:hypothetical protein
MVLLVFQVRFMVPEACSILQKILEAVMLW